MLTYCSSFDMVYMILTSFFGKVEETYKNLHILYIGCWLDEFKVKPKENFKISVIGVLTFNANVKLNTLLGY